MRTGAWIAAAAALTLTAGPYSAQADTVVLGGGFAELCSKAAVAAARRDEVLPPREQRPPPAAALSACDMALSNEVLNRRDLAATHVNRGILQMGRMAFDRAEADFDQAISLKPDLPEGYVNRGAALIAQGDYRPGIAEITRGLAMGPVQPEKAYYNRAIGYEGIDDIKSAYFDYVKAAELKPEWEAPRRELARFTVTQR